MRILLFLSLCIAPAAMAEPRPEFLGVWGTPQQCQHQPILDGGSLKAAPFEVTKDWLQQRDLWCQLSWFKAQNRNDTLYAAARAICGEDSNRGYWLSFIYEKDKDSLTLFWDETLKNGPLQRCQTS